MTAAAEAQRVEFWLQLQPPDSVRSKRPGTAGTAAVPGAPYFVTLFRNYRRATNKTIGVKLSMRAHNHRRGGMQLSRDSMTARVAGRIHTVEVAQSSIDKSEAVQRAKKTRNLLQREQLSTYQHKLIRSSHSSNKDHMAVKPSKRACAPCFSSATFDILDP